MATIIFNDTSLNYISGLGANGSLMQANTASYGVPVSACFGGGNISDSNTYAELFIFKGVAPTNFSTFTSISARQSDLLVALPIRNPREITYSSPTGARYLVAGTVGSNFTSYVSTAGVSANVLTVNTGAANAHSFIPGQIVTLSGLNIGNSNNINGVSFVVDTTPNATAFTANAANGYLNGNVVVATGNATSGTATSNCAAIQSGVANWFVCARWGKSSTITISTLFANMGAVIGSVSLPSGGGDLEIANTSIAEGIIYSSSGLYINFPYTWTV